jgi:hypothetical protein
MQFVINTLLLCTIFHFGLVARPDICNCFSFNPVNKFEFKTPSARILFLILTIIRRNDEFVLRSSVRALLPQRVSSLWFGTKRNTLIPQ